MINPAPLMRAICKHSNPMLPCPKMTTESPIWMLAVSTAAILSLRDCRQAASLFEMLSATLTREITGNEATSLKQPGRSKPMTGPLRHRELRSDKHKEHFSQGSLALAATRSPTQNRVSSGPVFKIRAQNSWPNNCTGASVSSRRLTRS